jgi:hypothetical protein
LTASLCANAKNFPVRRTLALSANHQRNSARTNVPKATKQKNVSQSIRLIQPGAIEIPLAQPPPLESEAGSYASGFQQDFTYENDTIRGVGTSQKVRRIPLTFQIGMLEVDRELGDEEPQEEPPNEPIEIY